MAGNIKGITIEFDARTTQLEASLRKIDTATRGIDKELKKVNTALKFNPTSVTLWTQKQTLLKDKIGETEEKLKLLKDRQKDLDGKDVDKNSQEYRELQREIIETESKLKTFKGQLQQIGNVKLKALSEQLKNVGKKATEVGKSLTTKVTAPLVGIGAVSLKAGMDFDTAMSQVAATMGVTVDEVDELRVFAQEMGSTTAFSATQAAEGLNYMALAGYDSKTAMETLPTVLNLAAAGAMELGAASDMVTDAQTALGLSTEETSVLVDQMAKASSKSNTSVSQLGDAILTVGANAKGLSGGTVELNQVLGLLADNGIKASEAGTHLRNILLAMNPTTDKAAQAWEDLGVSGYDAQGNLRPLEDVFQDLNAAMAGMSSEERTAMITKMFNKTDLASVNALLDTSAERWQELGLAIDDSAGSAAGMADTQLDNMQGSLTLLKSALEGAAISISDVLAPYVRMLADWLNNLVTKFNNLSPSMQKVITIIGVVAAAIGPALVIFGSLATGVGKAINTFSKLTKIVKLAKTGFTVLSSAGLLPIIAVVAAVVAAGILLYKNWDKIKAFALRLKDSLVKTWDNIKTKITNTVTTLKTKLSDAWSSIKTKASDAWTKIKDAITKPFTTAKEKIDGIIKKIKGLFPISIGNIFKNIKTPYFNVEWGSKDFGKLGTLKYPTGFQVGWHAQGGIFDSPSIIGVGEAGSEAVVPLDKFWDKLDKMQSGNTVNVNITISGSEKNAYEIAQEVKRVLIREVKNNRIAWQ